MTQPHIERNFGLDICRALAASMVVAGHMFEHSAPNPILARFSWSGLFGVDLFFCLSGFLIGRILLAEAKDWPENHETGIFRFWYRRWMRTLPLYFFYFIVSLRYDWRGATTLVSQIPYLLFCQNLAWPMPDFFRLSWSLAVEEWFYLLFPVVLLVLSALNLGRRRSALAAIAIFIAGPFLLRIFLPQHLHDLKGFDEGIRDIVVFRLDSIGFGVLIAYWYLFKKEWFDTLARYWPPFAALALGCIVFTLHGYGSLVSSQAFAPFYFLVTSFAFAMLIPKFNSLGSTPFPLLDRSIRHLSRISYSLYLGHIFGFMIVISALHRFALFEAVYPNPWLTYPLFLATAFVLACSTYYLVERTFLQWRDRSSDSAFHPEEPNADGPLFEENASAALSDTKA